MSENLIEDEFTNRPENDELAFLHYERMFRTALDEALLKLKEKEGDAYWDSYNHFMQTYINNVLAVTKELDLEILRHWLNNPQLANEDKNYKQIKYDIDSAITGIKVRYAQVLRRASVKLTQDARKKIRELINKIKLTIEGTDLPIPRREALLSKLNAFAAEVDRDRTKFEAFGSLVIEAASIVGKAERKLRPIRKWLDSIASVIREVRVSEDAQGKLPPPPERLPAPPKQIPPPSNDLWPPQGSESTDDDIPF